MTLRQYLALHRIKQSSFAATIGITQAAVSRYCATRMPAAEHLHAIARATNGAVTANDFMPHDTTSCGIGVAGAAGPGNPRADVPPSAARPTSFCEAKRAADKPTSAARPTSFCDGQHLRKGEEAASWTR